MTVAAPSGYPNDEQPPTFGGMPRRGLEWWRLGVAALIVAVVVAAIWLWGRPPAQPAVALVAVASEPWIAGQPPGAFEIVEVAEPVAAQFADLNSIVGSVVSHDIPSGTFVTPALLGVPVDTRRAVTVMRFEADTAAWPAAGPGPGSVAVVATVLGGCALDVTTLVDGADGSIVMYVDAPAAARLATASALDGLVVWPAPIDGWPKCRAPLGSFANPQFSGTSGGTNGGIGNGTNSEATAVAPGNGFEG